MSDSVMMPVEITRANENDIKVIWKDGKESIYPARALRLNCPCALCVDEITREKLIKDEDVPQDVKPNRIELVGNYAVKVKWSDGHNTGFYTFESLRDMKL